MKFNTETIGIVHTNHGTTGWFVEINNLDYLVQNYDILVIGRDENKLVKVKVDGIKATIIN